MTHEGKDTVFTAGDLEQIRARGITVEEAERQFALLVNPPGFLKLDRPCTIGDGIDPVRPEETGELLRLHEGVARAGRCLQLVPASGAASRMFRDLLFYLAQGRDLSAEDLEEDRRRGIEEAEVVRTFLRKIGRFPFAPELERRLAVRGDDLDRLAREGPYRPVLEALLSVSGMGYGGLPKGLISFHLYPDGVRSAFEEHLVEAVVVSKDAADICRVHFTVPAESVDPFRTLLEEVRPRYEERFGVRYKVGFSIQKPSTDTLAVDHQDRPFRCEDGRLLFWPGGHGALLGNLQDLAADVVLVKNIDNVAVDRCKETTNTWSRILIGLLIRVQGRVFDLLHRLDDRNDREAIADAFRWIGERLFLDPQGSRTAEAARALLHRPIRICGMVPNTGEPGGGPFWVRGRDGSTSLQIVESVQVDPESTEQKNIFAAGTHFNPVFMALGLRDQRGEPYDLGRFVDPDAVIVTKKSAEGRDVKVLERPGLWNGAMACWNTVFVELPLAVFNPVKTVIDLLRDEHQST